MKIEEFKLERFFAAHEFKVQHQMSASDCESMSVGELCETAGADTMDKLRDLRLGYTEATGDPSLRTAVSRLYKEISPDNVLIAVPEEAIFLTLQGCLGPGDHVIIMSPAYQSLRAVPEAMGCRVTSWPAELKEGGWRFDFDFLRDSITPDTKMLIINIPHNPTGVCFTHKEKCTIVDLLRPAGITLFADEMYWKLEYAEEVSSESFCDLYENAVGLSGLSKSYGLPGLRIGWLASRNSSLLQSAAVLKDYTTICSSAPSELLAAAAVENGEVLIARSRKIVQENLEAVRRLCKEHAILEYLPGQGGSIIFPRFLDGRSADTFSKQLLEKRSLLMLPGGMFDMPDSFFRVGLGRKGLPAALKIFEEEIE